MTESHFQLEEDLIYMNHAAVAPWPVRTVQAVRDFAVENGRHGAWHYPRWLVTEQHLREQLRVLLNARHSEEIALLKNTSEALSVVAWGLPWQRGDNVVISDQEFPSNRVAWESLARIGVETRRVSLHQQQDPEAALIEALDRHTRLLSVSSVQFGTGLRLDLNRLGQACRQRGVLFCIDAIQSLGALAFDAQACQADFVMADGHKWMLGPEGLAVFYCRSEVMDRLALHQYGWHMLADSGNYDQDVNDIAQDARRFECGSPNMLGIHALHASLSLLLETGIASIEQAVLENSRFLFDYFMTHRDRFALVTPQLPGRYAGIVTFTPLGTELKRVFEQLKQQHIVCAIRGGGIRFSPHFHTPRRQLRLALQHLDAIVA